MEVKAEKRSWFATTWSWKVWSTTKPRAARRAAGASEALSEREPQRRSASDQVARVPGVPTETPLVTSSGLNR